MTGIPEPPDLEADEERLTELGLVVPPSDEEFTTAVHARIDREALAGNVVALAWTGMVDGLLHLLNALISLSGALPTNGTQGEDDDE